MKKIFAIAALAATVVPAFAQSVVPGSTGLSARVGAFFPAHTTARNLSKTWFAAGIQYKGGDLVNGPFNARVSASYAFSVDYIQRADFRIVPVMVNYVGEVDRIFFTAGVGVAFTRFPVAGGSDDKARFAYTLGAGYKVNIGTVPAFVEGKFWGNEKSEANGFGLYAGVRF
ncbi:hypothetical protein EON79_03840 [bacterium]|nr:MAG: hypothetical protein EON79_03840 [bacterium]